MRTAFEDMNNKRRLTPPSTPTKRRKFVDIDLGERGKKFDIRQDTITPPTTPTKPKSNVYTKAKALFQRGSSSDVLVGREDERDEINEFIQHTVGFNYSDSLYISGPPGCGKTAQLDASLKEYDCKRGQMTIKDNKCKVVKINCMSLVNSNEIFNVIVTSAGQKGSLIDILKTENTFKSLMIILDEIDCLEDGILLELFSLSNKKNHLDHKTKLIMVGISNAIDLTTKVLPLVSRTNVQPKLLNFKPYNFDKIQKIIIFKLKSLIESNKENTSENFIPIVNASAILLCCKKVSSVTGDLRRSFDLIIRSIEMLEKQMSLEDLGHYDFLTAPRVQINHMASVCNLNNGSILLKLNHLQKKVIVHLFNFQKSSTKVGSVNNFFDYYTQNNHIKMKKSDFLEILGTLDSMGVVNLGKDISIKTDYMEFKNSIKNENIVRELI